MERKKIMVVDDNTVNLATIEQDLKEVYEVVQARPSMFHTRHTTFRIY